jgi:Zn-dependent protease with chaperone function
MLCLLLCLPLTACQRAETPAEHIANTYAALELASTPPHANLPDYALPPDKLAQAQHLSSLRLFLHFGGMAWSILTLILMLWFGLVAWFRDLALKTTRSRWLQAYLFLALFLLARVLILLPLNLYGHHLAVIYGLSIQRWPSWFADLAKSVALEWLLGGALLMLLFWIIRLFPRRWWLVFWAAIVPITLAGLYLSPILVDPLYNHFEPLSLHHPALVAQLEHMGVPANHQFLMLASAKVTTPNAYVTGLGPSKRVVVWDTSLTPNAPPTPEVLWMVGHECGHYALNHVRNGTLLTLAALLPLLYLVYRFLNATLRGHGRRLHILFASDFAVTAILLLAFSLLSALTEPITNTASRSIEHAADIYGQEAIHGLVPDPQTAVLHANDTDGLRALEDPNPTPFEEFWTYNHPATGRRAAFGKAYNPWATGMAPKYFIKQ